MKMQLKWLGRARIAALVLAGVMVITSGAAAANAREPESKRLAHAKDLIAEEQWTRAVEELRAAARDPKEGAKDEVLFWLAHSLNQLGDAAGSLTTITQLERSHPSSRWLLPAQSLRLEIAVRLGRSDVLWKTAMPAPPPPPPTPRVRHAEPAGAPAPAPTPAPPAVPPHSPRAAPPMPPAPAVPAAPGAPAPPAPPSVWIPDQYHPGPELRIQALGHLIRTDQAEKVIPLLTEMALEADSPGVASRAVFVLAQSPRPEARKSIVHVAQAGAPLVRIAAVRELARFGGPSATPDLMQVYRVGDLKVKQQVVTSLGELWERTPLLTIVRTETDHTLKARAIRALGVAGGASELSQLYPKVSADVKRPIILSLFNARADGELIRIAEQESDRQLRSEIIGHLRLLGTDKAREYIQKTDRRE